MKLIQSSLLMAIPLWIVFNVLELEERGDVIQPYVDRPDRAHLTPHAYDELCRLKDVYFQKLSGFVIILGVLTIALNLCDRQRLNSATPTKWL